jgi:hypothetical protein
MIVRVTLPVGDLVQVTNDGPVTHLFLRVRKKPQGMVAGLVLKNVDAADPETFDSARAVSTGTLLVGGAGVLVITGQD